MTLLLLFQQVKMPITSSSHLFYLALCLLAFTSSATAGPETLCGAELVAMSLPLPPPGQGWAFLGGPRGGQTRLPFF